MISAMGSGGFQSGFRYLTSEPRRATTVRTGSSRLTMIELREAVSTGPGGVTTGRAACSTVVRSSEAARKVAASGESPATTAARAAVEAFRIFSGGCGGGGGTVPAATTLKFG